MFRYHGCKLVAIRPAGTKPAAKPIATKPIPNSVRGTGARIYRRAKVGQMITHVHVKGSAAKDALDYLGWAWDVRDRPPHTQPDRLHRTAIEICLRYGKGLVSSR